MFKKKNMPLVSVIMPVFNGSLYLKEAINSVLNQKYREIEFLIINDGSTDSTEELVKSYEDKRIVYLKNSKNIGITKTLNKGLKIASGKYVARMDCDDICLPNRFYEQVKFLEKNTNVGIIGTWYRTIGLRKNYVWKGPVNSEELKVCLLFETPLAHPTVMMRANELKKNNLKYETENQNEDYDLWQRAINYFNVLNIPKVLLLYRMMNRGISSSLKKKVYLHFKSLESTYRQGLNYLGIKYDDEDLRVHYLMNYPPRIINMSLLKKVESWLLRIEEYNKNKMIYVPKYIKKYVNKKWYQICSSYYIFGIKLINTYVKSKLFNIFFPSILDNLKLIIKCFISNKKII